MNEPTTPTSPRKELLFVIETLDPQDRDACLDLARYLQWNVRRAGTVGTLALALVGAEMQEEAEKCN